MTQQGYVLVIVLIFLLICSLLGTHALQESILLQKMSQTYYHELTIKKKGS